MGIWGNPAATKKNFLLILGVHLHPVHPLPMPLQVADDSISQIRQ